MSNILRALAIAGVPEHLRADAQSCIEDAELRADGLTLAKWRVRLFQAGKIAKLIPWDSERLLDVRPDLADWDIAPMLNITAHGDNGPWRETPGGGRPEAGCWLDRDPESPEYLAAVASNYWCKGEHPRSEKSRKAWYRRNAGEHRAWRLGLPVPPGQTTMHWTGSDGRLTVSVFRCGNAWLLKTQRRIVGAWAIKSRVGFEVDNLFGPDGQQLWFPIPGQELRAPVTWSVLPGKLEAVTP